MNRVIFDANSRKEYLTGFQKRKEERRAKAKVLTELKKQRIHKQAKMRDKLDFKQIEEEYEKYAQEEDIENQIQIQEYEGEGQNDENITVKVEPIVFKQEKQEIPTVYQEDKSSQVTTREKVEKLVKEELKKSKAPKKKPMASKGSKKAKKIRAKITEHIRKKKGKKKEKKQGKEKGNFKK